MFEINDDTDAELRDAEVIEHFAAFNIGDLVDHLCVHNHGAKGDEIRDEFTHMMSFVEDLESTLLIECDPPNLELHGERILVRLGSLGGLLPAGAAVAAAGSLLRVAGLDPSHVLELRLLGE